MARMRTLKPEFWEDEGVGLLSRDARLLYMATWNAADDEGILRWNAAYLKSQAFIYDNDLTVMDVDKLMAELVESRMIFPYKGGKSKQPLALIVKFQKHQRPNRPQASKMPAPSLQSPQVAAMYAERDEWTCHICNEPIPHGPESGKDKRLWLSLDHVHPRSKGGSDYPSNIKAAHCGCNSGKKDRVLPDMNAAEPDAQQDVDLFTESFSEQINEPRTAVVVVEGSSRGTGRGDVGESAFTANPRKRGTRIPDDWSPPPILIAQLRAAGIPDEYAAAELAKFRDYWIAKPGREAIKLDWSATWRNWIRNAVDRNPPRNTGRSERVAAGRTVAEELRAQGE